jgi:hypothetical protein
MHLLYDYFPHAASMWISLNTNKTTLRLSDKARLFKYHKPTLENCFLFVDIVVPLLRQSQEMLFFNCQQSCKNIFENNMQAASVSRV